MGVSIRYIGSVRVLYCNVSNPSLFPLSHIATQTKISGKIKKYKDGSFLSPHNHMIIENEEPNYKYFSLAYYIDDGNPDETHTFNGCVSFQVNQKLFNIRPKPGLLLIWESHLIHNVNPFFSKNGQERMMLSANIICIPNK